MTIGIHKAIGKLPFIPKKKGSCLLSTYFWDLITL